MEEGLKQRLVGALVLFLLAIIFLPLVLDGRDEENQESVYRAPQEPVIHITHKGSDEIEKSLVVSKELFDADRAVVESPEKEELIIQSEPIKVVPKQASVSVAQQSNIQQAKTQFVKEIDAAKAVSSTAVNSKSNLAEAWTVQVAAFSKLENAKALQSKLIGKSYMAYIETGSAGKKTLYRVFVGPELRKNRARLIQQALKKEFKLAGMVKSYQP